MQEPIFDPNGEPHRSLEYREMARRVNRKMDLALLPVLSLLYLFNGLDRSNVGNAETQGFTSDIGASPDDLNFAVSLFFVTFVVLQIPSAAIGRLVGAKHWITIMMIGWGACTLGHAFINGPRALIALRLMVGAFEAGFYPTAVGYLSSFYSRYDMGIRVALFFGQYAVAGAFSGSIAYGVFHIKGSLHNWQYLFIIEGSLTILVALITWFWLPTGPGTARFLDNTERAFAMQRIIQDNSKWVIHEYGVDGVERIRLTKRDFVETGKDWKLWYVMVFNICASVPSQAFSVFLPLVVKGLGYSSIQANLMAVPPYVCGAIGLYFLALSSDYRKERGYHIVLGILITLIGLVVTVTVSTHGAKYAGLCILLFGTYVSAPLTVVWLSGNTPAEDDAVQLEPGKRSLVLGANGLGNLAGVIGSQLYKHRYGPNYTMPFYVTLGFVAAALAGYVAYRFTLSEVNQRKFRILADKTPEEIQEERRDTTRYADRKWTFIYGL